MRTSRESAVELKLAWASLEAARFACARWHYAGVMPSGRMVRIGAWENGELVGVVIFSRGASPYLGRKWGLDHTEICELTRVAFRRHETPLTHIVAQCVRMLRETSPGLRLIISFADPKRGHHGGLYQACGWTYTGESDLSLEVYVDGRWRHVRGGWHEAKTKLGVRLTRSHRNRYDSRVRQTRGKHRYALALDRRMRRDVAVVAQPYPKPEFDTLPADRAALDDASTEAGRPGQSEK